ncbi:MAG: TonB family protein [Bacteroidia bacterium]|nr:TonB family protein [Bacteroidia bacterium]MDW8417332.1 TonB family protein [Bacteroidia bacterium]
MRPFKQTFYFGNILKGLSLLAIAWAQVSSYPFPQKPSSAPPGRTPSVAKSPPATPTRKPLPAPPKNAPARTGSTQTTTPIRRPTPNSPNYASPAINRSQSVPPRTPSSSKPTYAPSPQRPSQSVSTPLPTQAPIEEPSYAPAYNPPDYTTPSAEEEEDPDPTATIQVEKGPVPTNMDDIKKRIVYPPLAKEANIQGKVIVRVLVGKEGRYERHIVLRSPHKLLTEAVEKELPNLSFTPGIKDGKPVKVWVTIPFDFSLK